MDLYFFNGVKGFIAGVLGVMLFFWSKDLFTSARAWFAARKLNKQRVELQQYEARLRAAETCTACGHVGRKTAIRAKYHNHDVFGYMCPACGAHTDYNGSSLLLAERDWINKPLNPPEPDFDAEVLRSPRVDKETPVAIQPNVEVDGHVLQHRSFDDAPEEGDANDKMVSVNLSLLQAAVMQLRKYALRCDADDQVVANLSTAAELPHVPFDEDVVSLDELIDLMNRAETEEKEKPLSEEECFLMEHALQRDFVMVNGNANVYACTERQLVDFVRERGGQVERKSTVTTSSQGMAVDQDYHWNYDMSACPSGKAQLLTVEGIATHGKVKDYRDGFIIAWTGLPKTRE